MNLPNWILLIAQTIATAITGVVGWYFKKNTSRLDKLEKEQVRLEQKIKDIKFPDTTEIISEIKELEIRIGQEYVKKTDYNIAQGEVMKKLDRIYDILIERKG